MVRIDSVLKQIDHCDHCGMNTTSMITTPLYGAEITIDGKKALVCEACIYNWGQKLQDMQKIRREMAKEDHYQSGECPRHRPIVPPFKNPM